MSSRRISWSFSLLIVATVGVADARAESLQESAVRQQSQPTPVLVCPPAFSTPMFIPAEELELPPVTPEGWIIHNRPVQDCVNYFGNAEQRSREFFEKPLQLQRYNSQIRLLEAEVFSLQRRLANYRYFNKTGALFITVENARLALVATQEQLRNLRHERMLYIRLQNIEHELAQGTPIP